VLSLDLAESGVPTGRICGLASHEHPRLRCVLSMFAIEGRYVKCMYGVQFWPVR
jgi:hypothetical protein